LGKRWRWQERSYLSTAMAEWSWDSGGQRVPNGGYRKPIEAAIMKGLGVKAARRQRKRINLLALKEIAVMRHVWQQIQKYKIGYSKLQQSALSALP
jgi:hypothetical protein